MTAADDKDWTFVLDQPCPECGLDAPAVTDADVPEALRARAAEWAGLLDRWQRAPWAPPAGRWSALAYACHVRDATRVLEGRLRRILTEDEPVLETWDQDAAAEAERYDEQDPMAVSVQLHEATEQFAALAAGVTDEQRARTGRRDDGARFTAGGVPRYLLHESVHHLHDAQQGG